MGDLLLCLNIVCSRLVCLGLVGILVEGLVCCMLMIISGSFVMMVKLMVLDLRFMLGFDVVVMFSELEKEVLMVELILVILFLVWKVMMLWVLCLDSLWRMLEVGVMG